jgi:hypothetical protein
MGVLIADDLKKKMIYCSIRHGTFGKSRTRDETVTAGRGVRSNLTPYCNPMFFFWPFFNIFLDTSRGSIQLPASIRVHEGLPCFSSS